MNIAFATPKGVSLDSQYGVCFRFLIRTIVNLLHATGRKHRLHVVVERGHKSALNTERIFNETKQTLRARGIEVLGTWALAAKDEALPLMAADLAHSYALMRRPGGIGIEGYAKAAPEPSKGNAGLTFLEIEPDSLSELKREMQRERWRRQAYARVQKGRARVRSPSSEVPIPGANHLVERAVIASGLSSTSTSRAVSMNRLNCSGSSGGGFVYWHGSPSQRGMI